MECFVLLYQSVLATCTCMYLCAMGDSWLCAGVRVRLPRLNTGYTVKVAHNTLDLAIFGILLQLAR